MVKIWQEANWKQAEWLANSQWLGAVVQKTDNSCFSWPGLKPWTSSGLLFVFTDDIYDGFCSLEKEIRQRIFLWNSVIFSDAGRCVQFHCVVHSSSIAHTDINTVPADVVFCPCSHRSCTYTLPAFPIQLVCVRGRTPCTVSVLPSSPVKWNSYSTVPHFHFFLCSLDLSVSVLSCE